MTLVYDINKVNFDSVKASAFFDKKLLSKLLKEGELLVNLR